MNINEFAKEVHQNAVTHGWWETERDSAEIIALIHSEWSEALEEARAGRPMIWYACGEQPNGNGGICDPQDEYDCANYGREKDCKYHSNKPEGVAPELIDGCIRVFDYLGKQDVVFKGEPTLDYLVSTTPEKVYRVPFPRLIANLHLKTSQAYTMLRHENDDPEFGKRGFAILFEIISTACAWLAERGVDAERLMLEKHEYNRSRPYKHGKKF